MHLLISLIVGLWTIAVAILSVQNATAVSVQFLFFQSVQIPVGVVLAFAMGTGLLIIALAQPLWKLTRLQPANHPEEIDNDEDWA